MAHRSPQRVRGPGNGSSPPRLRQRDPIDPSAVLPRWDRAGGLAKTGPAHFRPPIRGPARHARSGASSLGLSALSGEGGSTVGHRATSRRRSPPHHPHITGDTSLTLFASRQMEDRGANPRGLGSRSMRSATALGGAQGLHHLQRRTPCSMLPGLSVRRMRNRTPGFATHGWQSTRLSDMRICML